MTSLLLPHIIVLYIRTRSTVVCRTTVPGVRNVERKARRNKTDNSIIHVLVILLISTTKRHHPSME